MRSIYTGMRRHMISLDSLAISADLLESKFFCRLDFRSPFSLAGFCM